MKELIIKKFYNDENISEYKNKELDRIDLILKLKLRSINIKDDIRYNENILYLLPEEDYDKIFNKNLKNIWMKDIGRLLLVVKLHSSLNLQF